MIDFCRESLPLLSRNLIIEQVVFHYYEPYNYPFAFSSACSSPLTFNSNDKIPQSSTNYAGSVTGVLPTALASLIRQGIGIRYNRHVSRCLESSAETFP